MVPGTSKKFVQYELFKNTGIPGDGGLNAFDIIRCIESSLFRYIENFVYDTEHYCRHISTRFVVVVRLLYSTIILLFSLPTIIVLYKGQACLGSRPPRGSRKVGLRWWSNVKEDGSTEWVFESLEDMSEISSADYKLFWIGLYATPVLWIGLLITGIMLLKFQVRSGPGPQ